MTLKVDLRFINELIELWPTSESSPGHQQTLLIKDYETAIAALKIDTMIPITQKNFYDDLHFSPIKIHLSISSQGCGEEGIQRLISSEAIKILLQSVGVLMVNAQDAVIELGCFERKHKFYNLCEMKKEVIRHYKSQALKQWYVVVLGFDLIGNPVGAIRGMADGVEYSIDKPQQGIKQGPVKFVKGLGDGVCSLFDHAVDGAAGSASKITGAIGKGIAAFTFDDDYQKKRRQYMNNKRHASASEKFASGGKGVVKGVYHGFTGIVKKPIQGAKKDGVGGFFKGVGKGFVGVVARPASGLIDFASCSFEEIKSVAKWSVEIRRQRNPRMFNVDKIIRPYNKREADGNMFLQATEKGKFASSDQFITHAVNTKDGRHVLIITDKRLIYAERNEIFGNWTAEWTYTWGEIKETPKRTQKGIEIVLKEKEKKLLPFGKGAAKKYVNFFDPEAADYIHGMIENLMKRQQ